MQMNNFPGFLESEMESGTQQTKDSLFYVIPVPLEQTVSYGAGTARGPAAILEASQQLERWDGFSEPLAAGIKTTPFIDCSGDIATILSCIEETVQTVVKREGISVVLGGEHTVSLAPIRVLPKNVLSPSVLFNSMPMPTCAKASKVLPTAMPVSCAGRWRNAAVAFFSLG